VTELRLRPRTVSELVDAAFALYRQNSTQYILVSALANVPLLILQIVLQPMNPATIAAIGPPVLLITTVGSLITYSIMSGAVVKLGSEIYLGREPDLAKSLGEVLPRVPALVISSLLSGLLFFLGLLFFIVGALYVTARYFAVATAIVLEGKGPIAAFGRSSVLSRDRKRHILNTLLLVGIIYFVLSFGVGAFSALSGSYVIQLVASTLFTIIAYPVVALTQMLLYYDSRIRNEGFDLEQMAATLDAGLAAPAARGTAQ
jgi:hypothetical protein